MVQQSIIISDQEKNVLVAAAKREGRSLSNFLRFHGLRRAKEIEKMKTNKLPNFVTVLLKEIEHEKKLHTP